MSKWEMVKLGDVCSPKQWKTVATHQLSEVGYPVYGANGIIGFYSEYTHEKETLLVTCRGATCGSLNLCKPFSYVNGNAMALDNLSKSIDIYFLFYFLKRRGFTDTISGSAQPQIIRSAIINIQIPLPPLEEQEKIAKELDKITNLIEKRKSQLEKLDLLVKARFIEMFGDPVTNPMGWEVKKLGEITKNFNNLRFPIKSEDREKIQGNYPYFGATGIVDYINDFKFTGKYLLISEDGKALEFRNKNIAFIAEGEFWVNNHAHVLQNTNESDMIFLLYYINLMNISEFVTGVDQKKLNKENLNIIPINTPPLKLQEEFATYVQEVEKLKTKQQQGLNQLEILYNSRMQEYFG